jgi:hypothetical protein
VRRLADDDPRDVPATRDAEDLVAHALAARDDGLRAEPLGECEVFRHAFPVRGGKPVERRVLDRHGDPRRPQAGGHPAGGADEVGGLGCGTDRHEDPLPRGPCARDAVLDAPLDRLPVHALRGRAQRQLAQRYEIALAEEALHRAPSLFGDVDLPLGEPLE